MAFYKDAQRQSAVVPNTRSNRGGKTNDAFESMVKTESHKWPSQEVEKRSTARVTPSTGHRPNKATVK